MFMGAMRTFSVGWESSNFSKGSNQKICLQICVKSLFKTTSLMALDIKVLFYK
jgi:hypothetical protein